MGHYHVHLLCASTPIWRGRVLADGASRWSCWSGSKVITVDTVDPTGCNQTGQGVGVKASQRSVSRQYETSCREVRRTSREPERRERERERERQRREREREREETVGEGERDTDSGE